LRRRRLIAIFPIRDWKCAFSVRINQKSISLMKIASLDPLFRTHNALCEHAYGGNEGQIMKVGLPQGKQKKTPWGRQMRMS
jgi:hypothetical protein